MQGEPAEGGAMNEGAGPDGVVVFQDEGVAQPGVAAEAAPPIPQGYW